MCKRNKNSCFVFYVLVACESRVSFISSLQTIPHDNEGDAAKNDSKRGELNDDT